MSNNSTESYKLRPTGVPTYPPTVISTTPFMMIAICNYIVMQFRFPLNIYFISQFHRVTASPLLPVPVSEEEMDKAIQDELTRVVVIELRNELCTFCHQMKNNDRIIMSAI